MRTPHPYDNVDVHLVDKEHDVELIRNMIAINIALGGQGGALSFLAGGGTIQTHLRIGRSLALCACPHAVRSRNANLRLHAHAYEVARLFSEMGAPGFFSEDRCALQSETAFGDRLWGYVDKARMVERGWVPVSIAASVYFLMS